MNVDEFLDSFGHLADAPGGVDRLRELVLQLAVRGKLVEQDPNDEPAEVLLKRIKEEKKRRLKEKLMRNTRPGPPIADDSAPFKLPSSWSWTQLAAIGEINPRTDVDDDLEASFIPMSLISEDYRVPPEFEVRRWGDIRKGYTHFQDGDVTMAKITPCFENKKGAVMSDLIHGIGAGTTELHVFRAFEGLLDPHYVRLRLRSPGFIEACVDEMTGTAGHKRVPKSLFAKFPFPLPPLAEQRRIVARVDELMELCDELETHKIARDDIHSQLHTSALQELTEAEDTDDFATAWSRIHDNFEFLFDTPEAVDDLRQSILELAVRGKLVEQDPNDEPADVLLERIEEEKKRLYKAGEIRKPKSIKNIEPKSIRFPIPSGWSWCRCGQIIRNIKAGRSPRAASRPARKNEIGVLKVSALSSGKFLADENKALPADYTIPQDSVVLEGDLLISRANTTELVGAVVFVENNQSNLMLSDKTLRLGYIPDYLYPRYLMYGLRSSVVRNYFEEVATGTSDSMRNLSQAKIRNVLVPFPPLAEQKRIVAKVDELMEFCDELEELIRRRDARAKRFAESVVHAAASDDFGTAETPAKTRAKSESPRQPALL